MGIGPVPAIRKLLSKAKKTLDDIDQVEINEAFAAQTLAVAKDLQLDLNKCVVGLLFGSLPLQCAAHSSLILGRCCSTLTFRLLPFSLPLFSPTLPGSRLNIHGGAIALGHPLGMSGARILTHLTHCLATGLSKTAIGSACIGGGQGIAVLLEKA